MNVVCGDCCTQSKNLQRKKDQTYKLQQKRFPIHMVHSCKSKSYCTWEVRRCVYMFETFLVKIPLRSCINLAKYDPICVYCAANIDSVSSDRYPQCPSCSDKPVTSKQLIAHIYLCQYFYIHIAIYRSFIIVFCYNCVALQSCIICKVLV